MSFVDNSFLYLFKNSIIKKRFVSNIARNTEYDFNLNRFIKPKIIFNPNNLNILPVNVRPSFLLFYHNNESAIIELVNNNIELNEVLRKYSGYSEEYLGNYRYILCIEDINTQNVPDNWGILKIDNIKNRKFPYVVLMKPAEYVNKNIDAEMSFLIKSLSFINNKMIKIHDISAS